MAVHYSVPPYHNTVIVFGLALRPCACTGTARHCGQVLGGHLKGHKLENISKGECKGQRAEVASNARWQRPTRSGSGQRAQSGDGAIAFTLGRSSEIIIIMRARSARVE